MITINRTIISPTRESRAPTRPEAAALLSGWDDLNDQNFAQMAARIRAEAAEEARAIALAFPPPPLPLTPPRRLTLSRQNESAESR